MKLLITAISLLLALNSFGASYFVSNEGNDAWSGTRSDSSWLTVAKVNTRLAAAGVVAGDTVFFKAGQEHPNGTAGLVITQDGTDADHIVFDSYSSGANPILDGTTNSSTRGIDVRNRSYIEFRNLTFNDQTTIALLLGTSSDHVWFTNLSFANTPTMVSIGAGTFPYYIFTNCTFGVGSSDGWAGNANMIHQNWTLTNCTWLSEIDLTSNVGNACQALTINGCNFRKNVLIQVLDTLNINNSRFYSPSGYGLQIYGTKNATLDSVYSDSCNYGGLYISSVGAAPCSTFSITNSTFNYNSRSGISHNGMIFNGLGGTATIENCEASRNGGDGFNIHADWTNVVFDHCTANSNGTTGATTDGDGFTFHDSTTGVIRYSYAANNLKSAFAHVGKAEVEMYYNILYHATNGTIPLVILDSTGANKGIYTFYNNVVYSPSHTRRAFRALGVTADIKNNIFYGFDTTFYVVNDGNITEDYNCVYGYGTAGYIGLTAGAHDVSGNPRFVSGSNFHIRQGSSAKKSGTDLSINLDYEGWTVGATPNMGAYERVWPSQGNDESGLGKALWGTGCMWSGGSWGNP